MVSGKVLLLLPSLILAANAAAGADQSSGQPDLLAAGIKMIAVLSLIVGLLLLVSYVANKTNIFGKSLRGKTRSMEILETLYLGPKRSLALVKIGEAVIVIGLTPTSISCLARLDQPKSGSMHERWRRSDALSDQHGADMASLLQTQPEAASEPSAPGFETILHSLMDRLKTGSSGRRNPS